MYCSVSSEKPDFLFSRIKITQKSDIITKCELPDVLKKNLFENRMQVSCFKNQQLVTQSLRDRVSALENENKVFHDRLAIDYNTDPTQNNSGEWNVSSSRRVKIVDFSD